MCGGYVAIEGRSIAVGGGRITLQRGAISVRRRATLKFCVAVST